MKLDNVGDEELLQVRQLLYEQTGLSFEGSQWTFFKRRILKKIEESKFQSVRDYISYLKFDRRALEELKDLYNLLTVNETYFFRETPQLNALTDTILPEILGKKRSLSPRSVRIWSAASSNGSEIYTIALLLKEKGLINPENSFSLQGSDINTEVITRARQGLYNDADLRNTQEPLKSRYFKKQENGYQLCDDIRRMATFNIINLFLPQQTGTMRGMDIIFCRNVLIYFDLESKKKVTKHLYDSLVPGGYLFLGMTDTLFKVSNLFLLKPLKGVMVYQKPEGGKE